MANDRGFLIGAWIWIIGIIAILFIAAHEIRRNRERLEVIENQIQTSKGDIKVNNADLIEKFNKERPVGSPITIRTDTGGVLDCTVAAPASMLGDQPVVWPKGIRGCYDLRRVWGYCHEDPQ